MAGQNLLQRKSHFQKKKKGVPLNKSGGIVGRQKIQALWRVLGRRWGSYRKKRKGEGKKEVRKTNSKRRIFGEAVPDRAKSM